METIHFATDGIIGVNLSADEKPNGDILIIRSYQTASPKQPEMFTLMSEEMHGLMEYLNNKHREKATSPLTVADLKPGDKAELLEDDSYKDVAKGTIITRIKDDESNTRWVLNHTDFAAVLVYSKTIVRLIEEK